MTLIDPKWEDKHPVSDEIENSTSYNEATATERSAPAEKNSSKTSIEPSDTGSNSSGRDSGNEEASSPSSSQGQSTHEEGGTGSGSEGDSGKENTIPTPDHPKTPPAGIGVGVESRRHLRLSTTSRRESTDDDLISEEEIEIAGLPDGDEDSPPVLPTSPVTKLPRPTLKPVQLGRGSYSHRDQIMHRSSIPRSTSFWGPSHQSPRLHHYGKPASGSVVGSNLSNSSQHYMTRSSIGKSSGGSTDFFGLSNFALPSPSMKTGGRKKETVKKGGGCGITPNSPMSKSQIIHFSRRPPMSAHTPPSSPFTFIRGSKPGATGAGPLLGYPRSPQVKKSASLANVINLSQQVSPLRQPSAKPPILDVYGLAVGQGISSDELLEDAFKAMGLSGMKYRSKMHKNINNGQLYARLTFQDYTDTLNVLLDKSKLLGNPAFKDLRFSKPT